MGRLPILGSDHDDKDPKSPGESNEDGCPGSWYRSAWALSVAHYERRMSEHGFSENLHLSRSEDRLVLDAVGCLEDQRIRARNRDSDRRSAHMRSQNGNA